MSQVKRNPGMRTKTTSSFLLSALYKCISKYILLLRRVFCVESHSQTPNFTVWLKAFNIHTVTAIFTPEMPSLRTWILHRPLMQMMFWAKFLYLNILLVGYHHPQWNHVSREEDLARDKKERGTGNVPMCKKRSSPSDISLSLSQHPGFLLIVSAVSASACSGSLALHTGSLRTRSAASWRRRRPGSPCQLSAFQTSCRGCCQKAGAGRQTRNSNKTPEKSSTIGTVTDFKD